MELVFLTHRRVLRGAAADRLGGAALPAGQRAGKSRATLHEERRRVRAAGPSDDHQRPDGAQPGVGGGGRVPAHLNSLSPYGYRVDSG